MTERRALLQKSKVTALRKPKIWSGILASHVLARLSPSRLEQFMKWMSGGAKVAELAQAKAVRDEVISTSCLCAGEGCLQRTIATALICRLEGVWPKWVCRN